MTQKIKYILMPISFILITNIQSALSNSKFCEIKFNVQGGEQSLEKKLNIIGFYRETGAQLEHREIKINFY